MAVIGLLKDFSGWTSAHGIPLIGAARNRCIRFVWIFVFLGCLAMFSYQLYDIIRTYLKYEVSVDTKLKFEERDFPAVTICSVNPYKYSTVTLMPRLDYMVQNYSAVMGNFDAETSSEWGFTGMNLTRDIKHKARANLEYLAREIGPDSRMVLNLREFILECSYALQPCDFENDFITSFDPVYGACFQFNHEIKYKNTRSGPEHGLQLLIQNDQEETLPMIEDAGIRFSIHTHDQIPFTDGFGFSASVGYKTSFAIKYIITDRLPSPYPSDCTEEKGTEKLLYGDPEYSVETCYRSCFQTNIISKCGCADPMYDLPSGATYCTPTDMACVDKYKVHQLDNPSGIPDFIEECYCPLRCKTILYGVVTGNGLWPPENHMPRECAVSWSRFNGNETHCKMWYQKNTIRMDLYFVEMTYKYLLETPAYTMMDIILNLGGQFGLWLGFSVITVVEFFSLLVLMGVLHFAKRKSPKLSSEDAAEKDHAEDMDEIDKIMAGEGSDSNDSSDSDSDSDSSSDSSDSDDSDDSSDDDDDKSDVINPYDTSTSNIEPPPITYPVH